jgi:hypothetical protein
VMAADGIRYEDREWIPFASDAHICNIPSNNAADDNLRQIHIDDLILKNLKS